MSADPTRINQRLKDMLEAIAEEIAPIRAPAPPPPPAGRVAEPARPPMPAPPLPVARIEPPPPAMPIAERAFPDEEPVLPAAPSASLWSEPAEEAPAFSAPAPVSAMERGEAAFASGFYAEAAAAFHQAAAEAADVNEAVHRLQRAADSEFAAGDVETAVATIDRLIDAGAASVEQNPSLRQPMAAALLLSGRHLATLGRIQDAISSADELTDWLGEAGDPALRTIGAEALADKVVWLGQLGDERAVTVYDQLLRTRGAPRDQGPALAVAHLLLARAEGLASSGRADAALSTYGEIDERFGRDASPAMADVLAMAVAGGAQMFLDAGRPEEALAAIDHLLHRQREIPEALRVAVASGLAARAERLGDQGYTEAAIDTFDRTARRFRDDPAEAARAQAARSLLGQIRLLLDAQNPGEAVARLDAWPQSLGAQKGAAMGLVARHLLTAASREEQAGELAAAEHGYETLIARFESESEPSVREAVREAMAGIGRCRSREEAESQAAPLAAADEAVAPEDPGFGAAPRLDVSTGHQAAVELAGDEAGEEAAAFADIARDEAARQEAAPAAMQFMADDFKHDDRADDHPTPESGLEAAPPAGPANVAPSLTRAEDAVAVNEARGATIEAFDALILATVHPADLHADQASPAHDSVTAGDAGTESGDRHATDSAAGTRSDDAPRPPAAHEIPEPATPAIVAAAPPAFDPARLDAARKVLRAGDPALAARSFAAILVEDGPSEAQRAQALAGQAEALASLGRDAEAFAVLEHLAAHPDRDAAIAAAADAAIRRAVAMAESGQVREALSAFDGLLERLGPYEHDTGAGIAAARLDAMSGRVRCLGQLGEDDAAIAAYQARAAHGPPPADLRFRIARLMVTRADRLANEDKGGEALAAFDAAEQQFTDDQDPAVREQIALAQFGRGYALGRLGRGQEALAVYDEIVRQHAGSLLPALREQAAKALVNRGLRMAEVGEHALALADFDEAIERFGDLADPALVDPLRRAYLNRAEMLRLLGRPGDAATAIDVAIQKGAEGAQLREQTAQLLYMEGVRQGEMAEVEGSIETFAYLVDRFEDASELGIADLVTRALYNLGVRLGELDRNREAVDVYDRLLARLGDDPPPLMASQAARALFNKAVRLGVIGENEAAVATYDRLLARFGDISSLQDPVARALVSKAMLLGELGRIDEAIGCDEDMISRFGGHASLRELVLRARLHEGGLKERQGLGDAAADIYRTVRATVAAAGAPSLAPLDQLAAARLAALEASARAAAVPAPEVLAPATLADGPHGPPVATVRAEAGPAPKRKRTAKAPAGEPGPAPERAVRTALPAVEPLAEDAPPLDKPAKAPARPRARKGANPADPRPA